MKQVSLTIDGVALTVPEGTLLVEAAKQIDKEIPVYCYHPKLGPAGLCRICLVDVEKMPKLQIACNTVATDGMVVHTANAKASEGRRAVLEFLLLNHPLDCPICDKGGECDLQDYAMAYGQGASRKIEAKVAKPKAVDLGPTIVLDEERCIVCQRCVRFDDIVTQERSLVVKDRGHRDIIATSTDEEYVSDFSGNVTELCPVGALTSKTYRFKSRPWDLSRTKTTCSQCSVGCGLQIDERYGEVLRTMSIADDEVSDGWLCDRGRYNIGFYGDSRRLTSPLLRQGEEWVQIGWDDAINLWAGKLRAAIDDAGSASVAAIGGGRLTNEEAFLLQHTFRTLGVKNLDWRAGRQTTATPPMGGTYADLENAEAIVVVGVPPAQTAPVMDLRIRRAVVHRGARLVTVGPYRLASHVAEKNVARVADIPEDIFGVDRLAVVWDGFDRTAVDGLFERVAVLRTGGKSVTAFIPGEQPNGRGAEAMGMLPQDDGGDTAAIFAASRDGALRVLSLFGVNPALRYHDAALARSALERAPFSVVSDLFLTQTAALASLILPARGPFEKDGHVFDMTGVVHRLAAGHAPPPGTLSDGDILVALASALDVHIPTPHDLAERARSSAPPSTEFTPSAVEGLASRAALSPSTPLASRAALRVTQGDGALRVAIGTKIFAGGGTTWFDDPIAALRPAPTASVAPATAAALNLHEGDTIQLSAGERTARPLRVRMDDAVPEGVVAIVDGLPDAPANELHDGEAVQATVMRKAEELVTAGASA